MQEEDIRGQQQQREGYEGKLATRRLRGCVGAESCGWVMAATAANHTRKPQRRQTLTNKRRPRQRLLCAIIDVSKIAANADQLRSIGDASEQDSAVC